MTGARDMSLAALTVLELSPPDMIAVAAHCGYTHVGLRPIAATPAEHHFPLLTDAPLQRATLAALTQHNIGVLDIEILRLQPATDVRDYEAALAFGAACGARFALVAGNDPDHNRLADSLTALAALAAPYHIKPCLEFMPWTDVPNIAAALAVRDRCTHENAGLLLDAFHLNRSGGTVADVPAHDARLTYLQLCDIAGPVPADMADILHEGRAERLFPGTGNCDLAGLLARLPAQMPISLEIPCDTLRDRGMSAAERARRAIATARALCATVTPCTTVARAEPLGASKP